MRRADTLRPGIRQHLAERVEAAVWDDTSFACEPCLDEARAHYLMNRLAEERGGLTNVMRDIAQKAADHETMTERLEESFISSATRGQKVADRVASVGGSWPFVIGFFVFLLGWISTNAVLLATGAFDPYPFILLNLVLSCLAAIQAPIIMMAQNRMAHRERLKSDHEFRVNLKAELEIATLHEKLDHLLNAQWQRLVEFQEVQLDLLQELSRGR